MLKFNAKALLKMAMTAKVDQIYLVGDSGVYFMPKTEGAPPKESIIYAHGCHPQKNEETWYDLKHSECGGDDFFQPFAIQEIRKIAATSKKWVFVTMTEEFITLASDEQAKGGV